MFGQNIKAIIALLLLALYSVPALAKKQNFVAGSPFGIGIVAGAEPRPRTSFASGVQTTTSDYSNYFAVEPFLDFVKMVIRFNVGWHFYPRVHGAGQDSNGEFTEASEAGSFNYGIRFLLAPYVNATADQRAYLVFGMGLSTVKIKNTRKFSTGTLFDQTTTERVEGSGVENNIGLGYEFFLVQNYSFQLEGGYEQRSVGSFVYKTSSDLSGTARGETEKALNSDGTEKSLHVWGPYLQLVLNLNL